jgi:hypothetical protein
MVYMTDAAADRERDETWDVDKRYRESIAECATNTALVFAFPEGYLGYISPMIHDHLHAVENGRPEV